MEELKLNASPRIVLGKKNRFLRRSGIIPAHLFGHGLDSLALQCQANELKAIVARAGTTRLVSLNLEGSREARRVFIREIQKDALTHQILHVDFYEVRRGEKMTMDVPIAIVGEAPAMRAKGRILIRAMTHLPIECLPEKVPPQIEVDISVLEELDQAIHVKDIVLDPEITVRADPEQLVVKVSEIAVRAEEEKAVPEAVAAPAEGEAAKAEAAPEKPAAEVAPEKKEKAA